MTERILSCSAALAEALSEEMERDETILIIGEDIKAHDCIFGQFKDLPKKYPEECLTRPYRDVYRRCGLGAALTGMRPLVDMHFANFSHCHGWIVNRPKIRYMFGGQARVPMVIWAPDGAPLGAAHHSQCLEAWFVHARPQGGRPFGPADVKV
jgi:pyruvate dehydrogenase E1 component beta subunit